MAEPTLQQVFGANATQDSTTLTISKADLTATGLTASSNNTAESLLVALVKKWQSHLTTTAQESNADQQITVENGFDQIVFRNNTNYRQYSKTINLQKPDTATEIDPNDY